MAGLFVIRDFFRGIFEGMMLLGTQKINKAGHLEIGGCDTVQLAETFGTPLYVMDETLIRENCRRYINAFRTGYGNADIAFAGKSLMTSAVCKIIEQEGLYLDVASGGELYTAKTAGYPLGRILFHGNNKSVDELQMSLDLGVGCIVVDNFLELARLDELARASKKRAGIMLRLTPGIDPHTHRLIRTGQSDTKFGFNIKDGSAILAVQKALECTNIDLIGLHCHVGSQLLDTIAHVQAARIMVRFIAEAKVALGYTACTLNLGGGLGIRYTSEHNPPTIEEFAEALIKTVKRELAKHKLEAPRLMVEPGRSIVGEAGTTLYRVGTIKEVQIKEAPGKRTYVSVDGGLSDNPRPSLYDAKYEAIIANRAEAKLDAVITLTGKHCETDTLIKDTRIANPATGDIIAVYSTGAYNYSMASNYNRLPRPAAVLVSNGTADVIIRRETLEDIVSHDEIPERLSAGAEMRS